MAGNRKANSKVKHDKRGKKKNVRIEVEGGKESQRYEGRACRAGISSGK